MPSQYHRHSSGEHLEVFVVMLWSYWLMCGNQKLSCNSISAKITVVKMVYCHFGFCLIIPSVSIMLFLDLHETLNHFLKIETLA